MPHSSGGGSSGGGFSGGGGSGGSGGVSDHYFPGAHRYRKHYSSTGRDEYVYASAMPRKGGIGTLILFGIIAVGFISMTILGVRSSVPRKLEPKYTDVPAIYDDVEVFRDSEEKILQSTIDDYCELTGICPVLYTVSASEWSGSYSSLEDYTFKKYVNNFSDEQHFVIVYSVPDSEIEYLHEGTISKTNFVWHAVQGDETDPLITEDMFDSFGNLLQNNLMKGVEPAKAFNASFIMAIEDASGKLNGESKGSGIKAYLPLIVVIAFFGFIFAVLIAGVVKEKDVVYEEVPLDSNDYSESDRLDSIVKNSRKAGNVVSFIFMTPFVLVGVGIISFGIKEVAKGGTAGAFMLIFGLMWTSIIGYPIINNIIELVRAKKGNNTELHYTIPQTNRVSTVKKPAVDEESKDEIDYSNINPFVPAGQKPASSSTEAVNVEPDYSAFKQDFDPKYFGKVDSGTYEEDEDYKRMKRQGFE